MDKDRSFENYSSYELAKKAAEIALTKKARNILILDLRKLTTVTDYFVICSGDMDLHVKAIVDEIEKKLEPYARPWHIEGYQNLSWVLMDYVDFVVHVFREEKRRYYNLEKLWGDAPVETVGEDEEEVIV
ncbi:MAG: ribosome silencing factor [Candidatus Neomarinimicrobiota bacterium]|nr:ribosome silencing factor [Candidatus Neomarinimicrobiota bacterium]RKY49985.1 MAG: ribosome silencing factor [Candidatus Neomarinimicrobiota bacterium]RKY50152.1 MAG: ribosome silencing factor [Candidatus Neomarinimicrobiota bacterium]